MLLCEVGAGTEGSRHGLICSSVTYAVRTCGKCTCRELVWPDSSEMYLTKKGLVRCFRTLSSVAPKTLFSPARYPTARHLPPMSRPLGRSVDDVGFLPSVSGALASGAVVSSAVRSASLRRNFATASNLYGGERAACGLTCNPVTGESRQLP
eukprot:6184751-Prymnesium_polylepis.1